MTREKFVEYVESFGCYATRADERTWECNLALSINGKMLGRVICVKDACRGDQGRFYDELKLEFDKIYEYEKRNHDSDKFANVWFESKETGVREDIADLLVGLDDSMFCDCDEDAEVDDLVEVNMTDAYGRDWYEESEKIYENVKWHVLRDLEWIMQNKREYCIPYIACRSTLTAKEIDDILLEEEPLALDAVVQIAHAMGHRVEINFVREDGGDE